MFLPTDDGIHSRIAARVKRTNRAAISAALIIIYEGKPAKWIDQMCPDIGKRISSPSLTNSRLQEN